MRGSDYQNYISKLQAIGYFKNEVSGSHRWLEMEERALLKFIEMNRDEWELIFDLLFFILISGLAMQTDHLVHPESVMQKMVGLHHWFRMH